MTSSELTEENPTLSATKISMNQDERFIRRCIELSKEALKKDGAPFGALVVKDGEIIAQAVNNSKNKISDHAEIVALDKAHKKFGNSDLTGCVLYSNCEPCPMCSFMAREYKVSKVVFALPSPFMGGYLKWDILRDKEISQFKPFFKEPPEVISGVLEPEAKKVFDKTPLWMFGNKAREDKRSKA
jgi:tRNA(adenine34) deaminase